MNRPSTWAIMLIMPLVGQSPEISTTTHITNKPSYLYRFADESAEFLKIIGLAATSAVVYGITLDMFTAHICPSYFTQGFHKEMAQRNGFGSWFTNPNHPTKLAFAWGTAASIGTGLLIGIPLAFACRLGPQQLTARDLIKPLFGVLAITGITSLCAGLYGYHHAKNNTLDKNHFRAISTGTPENELNYYIADAYAHTAAYAAAAVCGVGLVVGVTGYRLAFAIPF